MCEDQTPSSGLWINDLPGVTFKRGALTANEEDVTSRGFFDRIDELAVEQVKRDFFSRLSNEFQFNKIIESGRIGRYLDTYSNATLPVTVEKRQDDPFSQIYIQSIDVWTEAAVVSGAQVLTVSDGVTTESFAPAMNGITNIPIDFTTDQEMVTITMPLISYRDVYLDDCTCLDVTNTAGIRIYYQCLCSAELFACQYEHLLRYAILYKMGILFLEEVMFGDRLNRWATAKEKHDMILENYKYNYEEAMLSTVHQIKHSMGNRKSDCLNCQNTKIIDVIP